MGLINPIGGMRPSHPMSSGKPVPALSSELMGILKDMGVQEVRAVRIQPGVAAHLAVNEMATITLNNDQKNALQGLGLHGILVAIFSEDDDINGRYKEKLKELHEHLLGQETIDLLKDAFGLSETPLLMEDDQHNGIFFLQQSVAQLREAVVAS